MSECRISDLRSIELGVTGLERSIRFYCDTWGLREVSCSDDGAYYLRARGVEHHVLCLRQTNAAKLLGITLAVSNAAAIDELYAKACTECPSIAVAPEQLSLSAGGGYGLVLKAPEGLTVTVSSDVAQARDIEGDSSTPIKLNHVVINSADVAAQSRFFMDLLGFRVSDSTDRMEFLRCSANHHSVALAHGSALSLNHAAFEMADIDSLMYGAGRLIKYGYNIEWGVGRHGPGNNVFAYFIDPDGFVVEYTTEMEQVDEKEYVPKDAEYWLKFPDRPCRWGIAREASERVINAMSGEMT
ncbi:VOC family protein [Paraburkholderia xenovorans]